MTNQTNLNSRACVLFALVGLAIGMILGWLAANSWLGMVFLVIVVLIFLGAAAEMDFLVDIATALGLPIWKITTYLGERWAGIDPGQPVHAGLRVIYALAVGFGLFAMLLIEIRWLRGAA